MGEQVGKYEVLTQLSAGGMAELFLGCTSGPGGFRKYVVIKRILPDAANNEAFVEMFLDEARITAAFSHPNIAHVNDLGEDESGLYVVMELVGGQNLNQVVAACASQREVLPLGFSVAVAHDCALALHYAHTFRRPSGAEYPVIHRDVAQKNIMVTYDGQVKLLDFGIAKASKALSRTKVGTVKGTTGYMSPEQVRGTALDGRSDVFSLGVVLWEMVTGTRLFSAESELEEMRLIIEGPIANPSEVEPVVPEELSSVVMRALARERADRFSTARDFARALSSKCADLIYEPDQRAAFMKQLFSERIGKTQALFDAADQNVSHRRLDKVVEEYRRSTRGESQVAVLPKKTKVAPRPSRRREKKDESRVDTQLEALQAEAEAMGREPEPTRRQWTMPLMLALCVLGAMLFVYKTLIVDRRPAASGLQRFPGEPDDALGTPPPTRVIPSRPPGHPELAAEKQRGSDPAVNAATPVIALPDPTSPSEKLDPRPRPRGQGEVLLALLPEATVLEGRQELGKGALIHLTLPSGPHLLTVVGPDGSRHKLSVPVQSGKSTSLKLQVAELPPE